MGAVGGALPDPTPRTWPDRRTIRARKSRMDQRTRERLPVLPVLLRAPCTTTRTDTAARLQAAHGAAPGASFTVAGVDAPPGSGRAIAVPAGSGPKNPAAPENAET